MHSLADSRMCPGWGSNLQLWRIWVTLTNWASRPGPSWYFIKAQLTACSWLPRNTVRPENQNWESSSTWSSEKKLLAPYSLAPAYSTAGNSSQRSSRRKQERHWGKGWMLLLIIANHILLHNTANGLRSTIHIQVILLQPEKKHLLTSKIHKYIRSKRQREII